MDLHLESITHRYGDMLVLEGIDLEIEDGQIVCVIGPSGCGKSTLLRFIGGLEQPDSGNILQVGQPPAGSLNPLTYIFQDFALLPWRTFLSSSRTPTMPACTPCSSRLRAAMAARRSSRTSCESCAAGGS